ncbi:coiled-coil protein [Methermicoccus shengliensis]|uniref:Phosphoserine phosphatase n=1 Tax=Methermicoccus shengliensis TaxID=660064 RepID=A0A832RT64_9EURY|nr:MAG: Phosphoserine phosphatase [Euryarchaeota archaeon 55_53]KUK29546.1 MAG: Phosphoserine phosphatase [Methanosarcinales archeaon 56_1174]HIH69958.1 phosphoserine phosphatase [Methermicoccus shengliensis]
MSEEETIQVLDEGIDLEALKAEAAAMSEGELKARINRLRQQIGAMERELRDCFSQIDLHRSGLDELRARRDELNAKVRELFEKANEQKQKRNEINERIAQLKQERDALRRECDELVAKIKDLKAKRDEYNARSKGRLGSLSQDYLRELDVFLNADIPLAHEINVYERLKELAQRIEAARRAEALHQEVSKTYEQCKACSPRIRELNEHIRQLSDTSQEHHEAMVELYERARAMRKEADLYHRRLKEKYEEIAPLREKVNATRRSVRLLRKEISVFLDRLEEIQLKKRDSKEGKKLEEAKQKLKQSGRLSLEELKVLIEDGSLKLE